VGDVMGKDWSRAKEGIFHSSPIKKNKQSNGKGRAVANWDLDALGGGELQESLSDRKKEQDSTLPVRDDRSKNFRGVFRRR